MRGSAFSLRAIRLLHTVVWALLVAVIIAIPITAWRGQYGLFALMTGIILVEVAVLVTNGYRCPLTNVAARYTDDRSDNFDIYLPLTIARYNKQIFGTLFVAGVLVGIAKALI